MTIDVDDYFRSIACFARLHSDQRRLHPNVAKTEHSENLDVSVVQACPRQRKVTISVPCLSVGIGVER